MRGLVFQGVGSFEYGEVADPRPQAATDAIVRVTECGVCGSDLHVWEGREVGIDEGTVVGHEFVGEIVECGSSVKRFKPGQIVCSPFTTNCGACFYCQTGLSARCQTGQLYGWVADGTGLEGTHAELVRVPHADATLVAVPEGVSAGAGILLGDNLSTGFYCAEQAGVGEQGVYAVLGCGTVGLLSMISARFLGARQIVAVDNVGWRRTRAERLGATASCSVGDAPRVVAELTDGKGVDAVLEAVGSAANQLAFDLVRPGGVISSVGVPTAGKFDISPVAAYDKNLTLKIGRCPARAYMPRLLQILDSGQLEVDSLITHALPLSEGAAAYRMFAERREGVGKMLLQPGS